MNTSSRKSFGPIFVVSTLALIVLGLTLPRLVINYGTDGDAIRGVRAANHLVRTGSYIPSRLPGNPLFEYLLALLVPWGGHIASNLLVLGFYGLSVWAFTALTATYQNRYILTATFALTPILLENAVTTMDYLPGLAFILTCHVCAVRGRYATAGALLALSIGVRISNGLFLLALIIFLIAEERPHRKIGMTAFVALLGGMSFYLPILFRYGMGMFVTPATFKTRYNLEYLLATGYRAVMLFGPIGTLAIAFALVKSSTQFDGRPGKGRAILRGDIALGITTIVAFVFLFLIHSDETEYLIPIIPYVYMVILGGIGRSMLIWVSAFLLSFSIINVDLRAGRSGERHLAFLPSWGLLIEDYALRVEYEKLRHGLARFHEADKAVIMTGMGPLVTYENPLLDECPISEIISDLDAETKEGVSIAYRLKGRRVYLVNYLSRVDVEAVRRAGYMVFMFSEGAPSEIIHNYKYDPYALGVTVLQVLSAGAFYSQSA